MQDIEIKHAAEADWSRVRDLRLRARQEAPDAFGTTYEEDAGKSSEHWRRRVTATGSTVLIATRGGADVGLLCVGAYEGRKKAACLSGMWVEPAYRGHGIGGALLDAAVAWARAAGYDRAVLHVEDANPGAIHLYAKRGFERVGAATPSPPPREHILEHVRELVLTPKTA